MGKYISDFVATASVAAATPPSSKPAKPAAELSGTPATWADKYYQLRAEKQALAKQVTALEKEMRQLAEGLINTLPKSDATGVTGKVARAVITSKEVPTVEDWDSLYKYMVRKKAFELLQRRVSVPAVEERWEAGEKVPGVGKFKAISVSVTKA